MFRCRRRMWIEKFGRRYYTGMILVCCTFILTYIFTKGTCTVAFDNTPDITDALHAIKTRELREGDGNINVEPQGQQEIRLQKVKENIEAGPDMFKQNAEAHIQNEHKGPMRIIQSQPPVKQIAFLKVHKAGSTTLQNILFRFGIRNDLTFVLPNIGHYVYNKNILPIIPGNHYDIFACHTIYAPDRFSMMAKGYKTLAIVREPLQRMISAAYYYRNVLKKPYLMKVPGDNLIHELINNYQVYDPDTFSRTRNSMGFDFGFSKPVSSVKSNDTSAIDTYMSYIQTNFELVLIMDQFDESLVLMRREFNWLFKDIIYLKSNSYHHPEVNLTEGEIEKFKQISDLDYKIYNTFYEIFINKVKKLGSEFKQEVEYFRQILVDVNKFCESPGENSGLEIRESVWTEGFEVTYNECELMKLKDLKFVERLKVRHRNMHGVV